LRLSHDSEQHRVSAATGPLWQRLQRRGVLRVGFSYALIAWLLLQIGDVVLEPLGAPGWVMKSLIIVVVVGFPLALLLAWFFELTPGGIELDTLPEGAARPVVRGIRHYADALIIGVLLIAVLFLLARQEGWIDEDRGQPVVGVLPFTELGAGDDAYFGAGLADTLTYKLGLLKQLIVLAPSSTFEFRGQGQDLKLVGAKLGATALLEGTVRRAGGMLRVNARLVDIASGQQLWAGSYDRSGSDVFAVQDEIAGAVTEALQVVLSPADESTLVHHDTSSPSAYDAYLMGRARLAQRRNETIGEAIDYFHQAIELDPTFALAHAGLAEAIYLTASYRSWEREWQKQGLEAHHAAGTAQALNPQLGEAYLAQAFVAMGDNDFGAEKTWPDTYIAALLKRAVALSPNNASALKFYANYADSPQESLELLQRAARLDPRSGIIRVNIGEIYSGRGEYDKAAQNYLQAVTAIEPPLLVGYKELIEMYIYGASQLEIAARWGRASRNAYPQDWRTNLPYARSLLELGAWDEEHTLLEKIPKQYVTASGEHLFETGLLERARLAAAEGKLETAVELAESFSRLFLEPTANWPDQSAVAGAFTVLLDIEALNDIRTGRPQAALERYRLALPNPRFWYYENHANGTLRTPVLMAVLHRLTGDPDGAERNLREFLGRIRDVPVNGKDGIGFTRFTIHAFLGETDAAIAALEEAMRAGWLPGWWGLKDGDFDPDYARVVADPRFISLYAEIRNRVRRMREDYRAKPGLPDGVKVQ